MLSEGSGTAGTLPGGSTLRRDARGELVRDRRQRLRGRTGAGAARLPRRARRQRRHGLPPAHARAGRPPRDRRYAGGRLVTERSVRLDCARRRRSCSTRSYRCCRRRWTRGSASTRWRAPAGSSRARPGGRARSCCGRSTSFPTASARGRSRRGSTTGSTGSAACARMPASSCREAARDARDRRHGLRRRPTSRSCRWAPGSTRVPTRPRDGYRRRRVVFLGHLVPRQGVETLLEALALLRSRGADARRTSSAAARWRRSSARGRSRSGSAAPSASTASCPSTARSSGSSRKPPSPWRRTGRAASRAMPTPASSRRMSPPACRSC